MRRWRKSGVSGVGRVLRIDQEEVVVEKKGDGGRRKERRK
jgi:hypothetical protein